MAKTTNATQIEALLKEASILEYNLYHGPKSSMIGDAKNVENMEIPCNICYEQKDQEACKELLRSVRVSVLVSKACVLRWLCS